MSKLKKYLKSYTEQDFDKIKKVPEFETGAEALSFFKRLKIHDRVESDVIDPETGEVLIEQGETKGDIKTDKKIKNQRQRILDRSTFGSTRFKDYVKKARKKDGLKEQDNIDDPDQAFNLIELDVSKHFRSIGDDMADEWLHDKNNNHDDFEDWAQSAAGEAADSIVTNKDPKEEKMFKYLKAKGVKDINGWVADEIYMGMKGKE